MHPSVLAAGVWGVLPTPFHGPDLAVDHASLERAVEFYRDRESTGLLVLGVFGEAARLSAAEQAEVVRTVTRAGKGLEIVVGLSGVATAPTVEQAGQLCAAGQGRVRAVMAQVSSSDPDALVEHLEAVSAAAGTGVVVQDYPVQSGVRIATGALAEAVSRCGCAVAVKSEAAPTSTAIARLTARLQVPVFGGLGGVGLLDELAAGAAGAMTGFSHPEGLWAAINAYRQAGFQSAATAYAPWLPLANFEGQQGVGLAIRKAILVRRGVLDSGLVRPPGVGLPTELEPLLDAHLRRVETL